MILKIYHYRESINLLYKCKNLCENFYVETADGKIIDKLYELADQAEKIDI